MYDSLDQEKDVKVVSFWEVALEDNHCVDKMFDELSALLIMCESPVSWVGPEEDEVLFCVQSWGSFDQSLVLGKRLQHVYDLMVLRLEVNPGTGPDQVDYSP